MTGFLAAIAARAVGTPSSLQPRRVQQFEHLDTTPPVPGLGVMTVGYRTTGAPPAPTAAPDPPRTPPKRALSRPARDSGQDVNAPEQALGHSPTTGAPTSPEPAVPIVTTSTDDLDSAVRAARETAERATRMAAERPDRAPLDRPLRRPRQGPEPGPVAGAPALPFTGPPAGDEVDTAPSLGHESPAGEDAPSAPLTNESPDRVPEPRVEPAVPMSPPGRPRSRRAQPVDLAALLREQVFSALTERGTVPLGVTPVVATTSTSRAPRPGTASVRAEAVRIDQPPDDAPSSGDVHVHIGRVSVTQAPPAAPRVPRSETVRRSVDHQAYLARRRERG